MADTYTLISSVTVGAGGASSIDFTSIPATYTDLLVKLSVRSAQTGALSGYLLTKFNASSTSDYSSRNVYGYNGSAGSASSSSASWVDASGGHALDSAGNTANTFASVEIYIPNYAGSNNKSMSIDSVNEDNSTANAFISLMAGLRANTAAINQITISEGNAAGFAQYSTAYLYGIKNS